jgi:hypothetical protein
MLLKPAIVGMRNLRLGGQCKAAAGGGTAVATVAGVSGLMLNLF